MTKQEITSIKKISHGYIDDVLSGKITAGRFVKLACQRQLNDLKNGHERGLVFREDMAARAVKWFSFLKLWKGKENKGKEFVLAPHYVFITWVLMGWYKTNGYRRFNEAYIEVARKNAKSTYAGGIGSYMFVADDEEGAECYTAAVTRDQAKIVWENINNLLESSDFADEIEFLTHNLNIKATNSKCEPLSSDTKSMDGLDTHCGIIDELHAHPTRKVYDLIMDSIGSRKQPLIFTITTAGFDQQGVCYSLRDYMASLLKNIGVKDGIKNDSVFGIIYTLDTKKDWPELKSKDEMSTAPEGSLQEDDWTDEDVWVKANPGLYGVSSSGKKYGMDKKGKQIPGYMTELEKIRDAFKKVKGIPSAVNNFLTKRLNIWTQQANRWIDLTLWDENNIRPIDEEKLKGRKCYGGIDLSAVKDLTVWVKLFPDDEIKDLIDIAIHVWCPESRLTDPKNKYRDQYISWERNGHLKTTPGNGVDYDFIRDFIGGFEDKNGVYVPGERDRYNINSISVDRLFQGYEFAQKLNTKLGGTEKDPLIIACGMGFLSMAGPCKEFERLLLEKKLNHGGNPILRWMADNVAVDTDNKGNNCPNKDQSQGKIDGIIGILLGLDRKLRNPDDGGSQYDKMTADEIKHRIAI